MINRIAKNKIAEKKSCFLYQINHFLASDGNNCDYQMDGNQALLSSKQAKKIIHQYNFQFFWHPRWAGFVNTL